MSLSAAIAARESALSAGPAGAPTRTIRLTLPLFAGGDESILFSADVCGDDVDVTRWSIDGVVVAVATVASLMDLSVASLQRRAESRVAEVLA